MPTRSHQRVDRRRRVLVDDSRHEGQFASPRIFRGDADTPPCRYNFSALQSLNAPIARYVPLRRYTLGIWFLIGLIPIVGLLALDQWHPYFARSLGSDAARCFQISSHGSFAAWFSSIAFGFATAVMVGIYSVRKHRQDDYRGRFTVWRLAMVAAVVASVDASTGFHNAISSILHDRFGSHDGNPNLWWLGTWGIVFGGILVRIMSEMSSSRTAVASTILASICYAWAGFMESKLVSSTDTYAGNVSRIACLLLGHHLVLFALVSYARQIVLEAMGIRSIPMKPENLKEDASTEQSDTITEKPNSKPEKATIKLQKNQPEPDPIKQNDTAPPEDGSDELADEGPKILKVAPQDDDQEDRKLSKAERRRQRKEKRRRAA